VVDLACHAGACPAALEGGGQVASVRKPRRHARISKAAAVRPCCGAGVDLGLPRFEMAHGEGSAAKICGLPRRP
jgi:hypothetical protein